MDCSESLQRKTKAFPNFLISDQIGKGFGWGCLAQIGHVDVASATDERYSIASTPSTAGYPPLIGDSTEKTLTTVLPACFVAVVTCFAFIVGYRMIRRGTRYVWQPQGLQARTLDIPELWDVKLHDKHRLLEYQDFEMVLVSKILEMFIMCIQ